KRLLYEKVKVTYGEVLYNWGLFNKRLEVLKRCDGNSELPDVFSPVIWMVMEGKFGPIDMCTLPAACEGACLVLPHVWAWGPQSSSPRVVHHARDDLSQWLW
ncbi:Uncharacterized protein FKW44_021158, partial [Caligus rogercresseyi]